MATLTSSLWLSPLPRRLSYHLCLSQLPSYSLIFYQNPSIPKLQTSKFPVFASSTSSFEFNSENHNSRSKNSVLADLIRDIEPFDVTIIQKDVPLTTVDAMKRTISGMLGLLPSNQFQVSIEAVWEPLSKLLISSMMTGYTLRNAEYRLCVERNLDIHEDNVDKPKNKNFDLKEHGLLIDNHRIFKVPKQVELYKPKEITENSPDIPGLEEMSPEAREYVLKLQSSLLSVKKELHEVKRRSAALQMQQFLGEEKNDLLDYLRSLQPEKVAELSEPASAELKKTINSVVHGLLATLSPKMYSKAPYLSENTSTGMENVESREDCIDLVENTSLQFQPIISLSRDYLARLLFWCMLLGHYLKGLEYRLELVELLSLSSDAENDTADGEQVA